jgi:hypothetical protein
VLAGAGVVCALGAGTAAAASSTIAWGTVTSAPAGARAELFGVAAAGDALAVGGYNPGTTPTAVLTAPYAEHWNGTAWAATPVPLTPVYPHSQNAQLEGVTVTGPSGGWAVGHVDNVSSLASQTLAYHWNGTSWSRSRTPDPAGSALGNHLYAVAARSASDVWAVGDDGSYPPSSLVLHWNGSTWRQAAAPGIGSLHAVAVDPGHVWAASYASVAQFDGTTWTTLPAPPVISGSLQLAGLAHSGAGLWAVGTVLISYGEGYLYHPYAALWNGTAWTVIPETGSSGFTATGSTGYSAVTASGSAVLAATGTGVDRLTVNGATAQVTPAGAAAQLTAVAADPAGNAWAVGWTATPATVRPAIINAPGIGQGGIIVGTGASGATVTWTGPASGSGGTSVAGSFATGGLPDGSYTVIASLPGCTPGVATAVVAAGVATHVSAHITCPA